MSDHISVDIDTLKLHPDAERVPMANIDDLAALRASLVENGQEDPIDITADGKTILDGRTRWTLLRELGATTIQARSVDKPPDEQRRYIVDRAIARRHLTPEQRRALNALLRETVIEVAPDPTTGEEVRIGMGQSQRARTLGVTRPTIQTWDREEEEEAADKNLSTAPTHQRLTNDRIEPLRKQPREVTTDPKNRGALNDMSKLRNQQRALSYVRRMESAIASVRGTCDGLKALDYDSIALVTTTDQRVAWAQEIRRHARTLRNTYETLERETPQP